MFSDINLRETKGSSLMWVSICCDMSGAGGRRGTALGQGQGTTVERRRGQRIAAHAAAGHGHVAVVHLRQA